MFINSEKEIERLHVAFIKEKSQLIIVVIATLLFFSCSPEQKLLGTWEMTKETINGINQPFDKQVTWSFGQASAFEQTTILLGVSDQEEAKWSYDKENEVITLEYSADKLAQWTVRILTRDRLVVYYNKFGFQVERDFKRLR